MWRPTMDEIHHLYEQHAKHLEADHWGKFLALASDGCYLIGDDDVALVEEALKVFGRGNFVLLRVGTIYADIIRHLPQRVVSTNYPHLEVAWAVRHLARQDWAYADTGFEGGFTVPSVYADLLGIEDVQTAVRTADGQGHQVATYLGQLTIVGIDEPLRVRFLTFR